MDRKPGYGRVYEAQLILLSMETCRVEAAREYPVFVVDGVWLEGRFWRILFPGHQICARRVAPGDVAPFAALRIPCTALQLVLRPSSGHGIHGNFTLVEEVISSGDWIVARSTRIVQPSIRRSEVESRPCTWLPCIGWHGHR